MFILSYETASLSQRNDFHDKPVTKRAQLQNIFPPSMFRWGCTKNFSSIAGYTTWISKYWVLLIFFERLICLFFYERWIFSHNKWNLPVDFIVMDRLSLPSDRGFGNGLYVLLFLDVGNISPRVTQTSDKIISETVNLSYCYDSDFRKDPAYVNLQHK